jgi:hypothetical protein
VSTALSPAAVRRIIKEEVHWALFQVELPDVPWSKVPHKMRPCTECGTKFAPQRWYSRFCSTECRSADYARRYYHWKRAFGTGARIAAARRVRATRAAGRMTA